MGPLAPVYVVNAHDEQATPLYKGYELMAITVSKASLVKAESKAARAYNALKNFRKEGEHVAEKVIRTGETSAMAFGLGMLNGYHGPITVAKMPLELLLAGGLELAGYFGLAGKHSDHLNNLGDGALAAFAVVKGVQVGAELKAKHTSGSGGAATATKGVKLSEEEIRAKVKEAIQQ